MDGAGLEPRSNRQPIRSLNQGHLCGLPDASNGRPNRMIYDTLVFTGAKWRGDKLSKYYFLAFLNSSVYNQESLVELFFIKSSLNFPGFAFTEHTFPQTRRLIIFFSKKASTGIISGGLREDLLNTFRRRPAKNVILTRKFH